jgi:C1A family cysteine protease
MPPIDDQLSLGACSADAIVAAIEYKRPELVGSRLFVYYNERLLTQRVSFDSGSSIKTGMIAVSIYGVCEESLYPYRVDHFTEEPSAEAYANGLLHRVTKYSQIDLDMNAMKNCLAGGTPFIASIIIYSSFQRKSDEDLCMITMPGSKEENLRGHAVLICGYDDSKQSWILRNSWGTSWGAKGYCYLPYVYLLDSSLCSECWAINSVSAPSETSA